jgi:hypothetical protein
MGQAMFFILNLETKRHHTFLTYSILATFFSGRVRQVEGRLVVAGEEFKVLDTLGQGGYSKVTPASTWCFTPWVKENTPR